MAVNISYGTTLTWNSVVVAGLTSINGIELSVASVDTTTHQSANAYTEALPGMITAGDVTISGLFDYSDTTGQQAMMTDLNNRTLRTGVITFPVATGTTWTFSGYVMGLKIGDADLSGAIPFTATIKPTGKPTFAIATSNNVTALTVTTAVLYPTFAQATKSYVGTSTGASVTLTPTFAAGTCTIVANGVTVSTTSTVASSAISLGSSGQQTTIVMTITETSKAPNVYTFIIAKTA